MNRKQKREIAQAEYRANLAKAEAALTGQAQEQAARDNRSPGTVRTFKITGAEGLVVKSLEDVYETDRKELSSAGATLGIVSALNAVGVLLLMGAAALLLLGIPASIEPEAINLGGGLGSIQGDDEFQPAIYAVFAGAAGSTVISALILFALSHIVRDTHDNKRALTVMAYPTTAVAPGDSGEASEAGDTDLPPAPMKHEPEPPLVTGS